MIRYDAQIIIDKHEMKTAASELMPAHVRRALAKLGQDIGIARRKRALTVAMMAERTGVSQSTYQRVEKGDPTVTMAIYAMTLFVLGFESALSEIADPAKDDQGLLLDMARLPKRIRRSKDIP